MKSRTMLRRLVLLVLCVTAVSVCALIVPVHSPGATGELRRGQRLAQSDCGAVTIAHDEVTTRAEPGAVGDGAALDRGWMTRCVAERGCWLEVRLPRKLAALYPEDRRHWITAEEAGRPFCRQ